MTSETENLDDPFAFSYIGQLPTEFRALHSSTTFCIEMTDMSWRSPYTDKLKGTRATACKALALWHDFLPKGILRSHIKNVLKHIIYTME